MERITAGWRLADQDNNGADGEPATLLQPEPGKTLFETIEQSGLPDSETFVIDRSGVVFAMLNIYPYTSGHVMVLPRRAVASLVDLTDEEYTELWSLVRVAATAVEHAFQPHGLNVGLNQGVAGGASQPEHLHVHVVPRWSADTNFITSVADTRILPLTLQDAWERIRDVWPLGDHPEADPA